MQEKEQQKLKELKVKITELWENRDNILSCSSAKEIVQEVLTLLDKGNKLVAEKIDEDWTVNQWLKQAILLSFRLSDNKIIEGFPNKSYWYDKVENKFYSWKEEDFKSAKIRTVPGCYVRYGSYLAQGVIVMPSFINIGASVGENTMIDSYATIGSCAYIGKNCHISSNTVIGGVLEPINANPVIIEDNCFIGANCSITEGVIVKEGSVIASGVNISASTKIYNSLTSEIIYGKIPSYSVVVNGSIPSKHGSYHTSAAIIIKIADKITRSKTSLNDLLRD